MIVVCFMYYCVIKYLRIRRKKQKKILSSSSSRRIVSYDDYIPVVG